MTTIYPPELTREGVHLGPWDGMIGPWEYGEWDEIAKRTGTNKASWDHGYMNVYESLMRHRNVRRLLEFGVYEGASLRMWREFWPHAEIVGVDVNLMPNVDGAVQVHGDYAAVRNDPRLDGHFDIIVDDCTHQLEDITAILDIYGPRLAPGGLYVIEDTLLDENPWYAQTDSVVHACRERGYSPLVMVPGRRWVVNGDVRGLWAFVVFTEGDEHGA